MQTHWKTDAGQPAWMHNTWNNRSKSFCNRRDAFFASKGVIVERIEATNIVTMSESALVRMLKNAVSKVQGPSHFTEIKPL